MMSVFTFMGANIMRQDDAYSFHIISKILETVIPALITVSTVKFLNFRTPEKFAVIYLKFKKRGQTFRFFVKKMQME